jgi:RpiR family transcriptional regulator, repressor of rpiB and als operon
MASKKLGFSGFRAFRSALAEYNNFPTTQLHAELFANDSAGNIVQKVVQASIKALEQNLAVIEQAAIEKAAKYLSSCLPGFLWVGGSAQVARDVLACEPLFLMTAR